MRGRWNIRDAERHVEGRALGVSLAEHRGSRGEQDLAFDDQSSMLAPSNTETEKRKATFSRLQTQRDYWQEQTSPAQSRHVSDSTCLSSSILMTAILSWQTPRVKARRMWSRMAIRRFFMVPPDRTTTIKFSLKSERRRKRGKK